MSALTLEVEVDGVLRRLALERQGAGWVAHIDGRLIPVDVCEPTPGVLSLLIGDSESDGSGGRSYRCVRVASGDEETIAVSGRQHRVAVSDPRSLRGRRKRSGAANGTVQIKASMPGRVARVLVAPGEAVAAHQGIVVDRGDEDAERAEGGARRTHCGGACRGGRQGCFRPGAGRAGVIEGNSESLADAFATAAVPAPEGRIENALILDAVLASAGEGTGTFDGGGEGIEHAAVGVLVGEDLLSQHRARRRDGRW